LSPRRTPAASISQVSKHQAFDKEVDVAFTVLFLAHAPGADGKQHRSVIDTGMYRLLTVVVRDQQEALHVCHELVEAEHIDSVLLCPGFTHKDVAEIASTVGANVGISVARGDGPSSRAARAAMKRAGYFSGIGAE
jgi:hypothetical protein